ncbi:unnamed protein product, partial [Rotaria sp. Silwood2]
SSSTQNIPSHHQNQISSTITNGYNSTQTQHSQSQSPVSFKSSIDALSTLISRYQVSVNNKTSTLTNNSTNGLPSSTITDQYGLVGLLQMIQQAEKNPDSSMLLNFDLTTLGLSMKFIS